MAALGLDQRGEAPIKRVATHEGSGDIRRQAVGRYAHHTPAEMRVMVTVPVDDPAVTLRRMPMTGKA